MTETPDWKAQLKKSSEDFDRLIRPIAEGMLRGTIEIVESETAEGLTRTLDVEAGIDLWLVKTGRGIRAIGNRLQWDDRNWRSFTVRASRKSGVDTEYAKRSYAMQFDYLYPQLTLQGYVSRDRSRLLGFAICRTKDLWAMLSRMLEDGCAEERRTGPEQNGQATFWPVYWDAMRTAGYKIQEWGKLTRGAK